MKTLQSEIMKALEEAKCLDPESENWSYHAASRIAAEVASQFREPSSPTVKESYKKEIITNLLKEILAEEDLDHLCCPACGDNLGLTFKYALKTWIEIQHLNKP